jgi:predicted DNA-binding transcriptional regulator AlpA
MFNNLLNIQDLSHLLQRSVSAIAHDLRNNPDAVPPRIKIPGTRFLRWRWVDVDAWLSEQVERRD